MRGCISAVPVSPLSCAGMSLGKATELCESVTVSVGKEPRKDQKTAEWGSYHRETLCSRQLTVEKETAEVQGITGGAGKRVATNL